MSDFYVSQKFLIHLILHIENVISFFWILLGIYVMVSIIVQVLSIFVKLDQIDWMFSRFCNGDFRSSLLVYLDWKKKSYYCELAKQEVGNGVLLQMLQNEN